LKIGCFSAHGGVIWKIQSGCWYSFRSSTKWPSQLKTFFLHVKLIPSFCGRLKISQVSNFARKSESGYRPVDPASQHNLTNISENDWSQNIQWVIVVVLLQKGETLIKEALAIMYENKNICSLFPYFRVFSLK